jgi:hypothetical protein
MKNSSKIVAIAAVAGLSAAASAQLSLTRIAAIDFSGQFVGSNLAAVAWNGTDLYVAGANNTGAAATVGITRLSSALGGGGSFSSFGQVTANALRGYTGLAIRGDQIGASVDITGAAGTANIGLYNGITGASLFNAPSDATTTGQSGVAFDPTTGGLGYASFGSGRFRQFDTTDGSTIWSNGAGPVNFDGAWGTAYRDTAFDADGNVYAREGAQLIKFTRTGTSTFMTPFSTDMILNGITDAAAGDNAIGQNVSIINDFGGVALWNDRLTGSGALADILKAVDLNGNAVSIDFTNDASFFLNSTGIYDFSYDSGSQTLAVSEWSSGRVYIYSVVPAPGAVALLGMTGLMAARRRR